MQRSVSIQQKTSNIFPKFCRSAVVSHAALGGARADRGHPAGKDHSGFERAIAHLRRSTDAGIRVTQNRSTGTYAWPKIRLTLSWKNLFYKVARLLIRSKFQWIMGTCDQHSKTVFRIYYSRTSAKSQGGLSTTFFPQVPVTRWNSMPSRLESTTQHSCSVLAKRTEQNTFVISLIKLHPFRIFVN